MTRFRDISIRKKLLLAFGVIVLLSAMVGMLAFAINASIKTSISQIRKAALHKAEGVSVMAESLRELRGYEQELLVEKYRAKASPGQGADIGAVNRITGEISATCKEFEEKGVAICRQDAREDLELSQSKGHVVDVQEAKEELLLLDHISQKFPIYADDLARATLPNEELFSTNDLARQSEDYDEVSDLVEDYEQKERAQLDTEAHEIEDSVQHANLILLCFALTILAISVFLIRYIDRLISYPIGLLSAAAQRISKGDLDSTIDLKTTDEFGLLAGTFNQMTHDLRTTTVSKDYVDSILKSMVNSLIVLHPNHTIQLANEATFALLGYTIAELEGQPMDMILKVPQTRSDSVLDEAQEKGFLSNVDVNYQARDSHLIPMSFSASVLRNSSGSVVGLICVAQDVLERKKAERELEQANKQLLETSRQAGMAEVATSVLHNVGNVLNSVNVSSAVISDKVKNSKIASFTKAVALMEEHQSNLAGFLAHDEKGRKLPGYLSKLAVNLAYEQKEILQEVDSLAGNILHIKEIVATQQNYARVSGITESLMVKDLVEDALRINAGAMERHGVTVVREYADTPPVLIEKHKMLLVLVNLIGNAKYACEASAQSNKQVTLRVTHEDNRIKVSVIDTGVGISKENLTRIFGYGFTTKKEGHGFGLHSSALAAKEMGGTLTVSSEGPEQGATFTLEIPILPQNKV